MKLIEIMAEKFPNQSNQPEPGSSPVIERILSGKLSLAERKSMDEALQYQARYGFDLNFERKEISPEDIERAGILPEVQRLIENGVILEETLIALARARRDIVTDDEFSKLPLDKIDELLEILAKGKRETLALIKKEGVSNEAIAEAMHSAELPLDGKSADRDNLRKAARLQRFYGFYYPLTDDFNGGSEEYASEIEKRGRAKVAAFQARRDALYGDMKDLTRISAIQKKLVDFRDYNTGNEFRSAHPEINLYKYLAWHILIGSTPSGVDSFDSPDGMVEKYLKKLEEEYAIAPKKEN